MRVNSINYATTRILVTGADEETQSGEIYYQLLAVHFYAYFYKA
jgi:hypothetical protein